MRPRGAISTSARAKLLQEMEDTRGSTQLSCASAAAVFLCIMLGCLGECQMFCGACLHLCYHLSGCHRAEPHHHQATTRPQAPSHQAAAPPSGL
jgi:hypothetical protein